MTPNPTSIPPVPTALLPPAVGLATISDSAQHAVLLAHQGGVQTAVADVVRRPRGESRSVPAVAGLLHFLLHRGPVSAGPQWDGPVRRMRETPAQRYETGQDGTRGEAGHPAHNPKVAGSNPAPATIERPGIPRDSGPSSFWRAGRWGRASNGSSNGWALRVGSPCGYAMRPQLELSSSRGGSLASAASSRF